MVWRDEKVLRTNYALNPAMRATSGTTTVRTNYDTNPNMRSTTGTTTVTNYFPDPFFSYGTGGYSNSGTDIIAEQSTEQYLAPGAHSLKVTRKTTTSWSVSGSVLGIDASKLPVGTSIFFSGMIYVPSTNVNTAPMGYLRIGGGAVTATSSAAFDPSKLDQWQPLTVTAKTSSQTGSIYTFLYAASADVGDVCYFANLRVSVAVPDTSAADFSGDTPDGQFTYAWTGTPGASSSVMTAPSVTGWVSFSNAVMYQVKDPDGTCWNTGAGYTNTTRTVPTNSYYAIRFRCRWSDRTRAGGPNSVSVQLRTTDYSTANAVRVDDTDWYVGIASMETSTNYVRVYIGSVGLDVTSMLIEQVHSMTAEPGSYFDGDTVGDDTFTYSWTGGVDGSTSTQTANKVANIQSSAHATDYQAVDENGDLMCRWEVFDPSTVGNYVVPGVLSGPIGIRALWRTSREVSASVNAGNGTGKSQTIPANTWVELSGTSIAGSGSFSGIVVYGAQAGDIYDMKRILVEPVSDNTDQPGPYFDGSTPGFGGLSNRWTSQVDASASQQYLAALPYSSYAKAPQAQEHWFADGYDLTTYAFGITKADLAVPEIRGSHTTIPWRSGVVPNLNRSYNAGEIALSMWVLGCEADGSIPPLYSKRRAIFERNLHFLLSVLQYQSKPIMLVKTAFRPDNGIATSTEEWRGARALVTGSTSYDTMMSRQRAELVVTLSLVDAFWSEVYPLAVRTATGTYDSDAGQVVLELTDLGDTSAPVEDGKFHIQGPVTNPKITCPDSGSWIQYTGTLNAGNYLDIDAGACTAVLNGNLEVSDTITRGGTQQWMYLPTRGTTNLYPTLWMTGSGMTAGTTLKATYTRKYLVT